MTQLINGKDFFLPPTARTKHSVPSPGMATLVQCGCARAHVDLIRKSVGFSCSGGEKKKKRANVDQC